MAAQCVEPYWTGVRQPSVSRPTGQVYGSSVCRALLDRCMTAQCVEPYWTDVWQLSVWSPVNHYQY
jgi:hypothetical protein